MKRILSLPILLVLLCSTIEAQAQQRVRGIVVNQHGEGLEFVNVVAKRLSDSTFVRGAVTDSLGAFAFEGLPEACYLSLSSVGYEQASHPISETMRITLREAVVELNSLVVKADRPQIRLRHGALEMSVQGTTLAYRSDIMEVLGQVPGLRTSLDGSVGLISGGRLMIYLNGREVHEVSDLRMIDIKRIKSLSLDNAPGARYPSDVRAVLHIRTERDLSALSIRLMSWNRLAHFFSSRGEAHLAYNKGKANYYAMLFYGRARKRNTQDLETLISETEGTALEERLTTNLVIKPGGREVKLMGGADFSPRSNLRLGVKYVFGRDVELSELNDYSRSYIGPKLNDEILSLTQVEDPSALHHLNAFASWDLTPRINLTLNGDYLDKCLDRDQTSSEQSLLHQTTTPIVIRSKSHRRLWQGNAILGYSFEGGQALELGVEANDITGDSHQLYGLDLKRVSDYTNDERVFAGFASYRFALKGWDAQLGLRYERAQSALHNRLVGGKDPDRSWGDLFYAVKLSGKLGKTMHSLSLGSSILRPTMEQLTNNTYRSNQYLMQEGNPNLVPQRNHSFGYNLIFSNYYFAASYALHRDLIATHIRANREVPSGYIFAPANYRRASSLELVANARERWGWYSLSATAAYQYNHIEGLREGLMHQTKPLYYLRLNHGFTLPRGYYLEAEYSYQSASTMKIYNLERRHVINMYANKSFFDGRLQVSLRLMDLLRTGGSQLSTAIGGVALRQSEYSDSRSIHLNFTYRFNKERKYRGRDTASEAINRL